MEQQPNTKTTSNGFNEWMENLKTLSFEEYAEEIKKQIIKSPELDEHSRRYFNDCFSYVMETYKSGKPLSTSLMKTHLVNVKGYKQLTVEEFSRVIIMLSLCGFSFDMQKK